MPQTLLISSLSTDFQQACLPNNRDRNDKLKDTFEAKFNSPDSKLHWITVELIDKSIRNTKLGKAAGFDGIEAEHLRYAHPKICVMLSLLFNVMIIHGVVPSTFGLGITVTLLKGPNLDSSVADNYRGITLSVHISKIQFCGIHARFVWQTHARNLISTNHCTGYGFTSFRTVNVYLYMLAKTVLGFCKMIL